MLLEEESRRRPTVGEILAKADLRHFFDEEAGAAEEESETDEEGGGRRSGLKKTMKVRTRKDGRLYTSLLQRGV